MENISLYDLLIGQFASEENNPDSISINMFEQLSEEKKLRQSIIENLQMVLKTRQGSVQHLPDFGMPDILQVYFNSGNSIDPIRKQIKDTILKYEPRIGNVQVTKTEFDQKNMRISLRIVASIKENPNKEILLTEFSTTGWTKIVFERDEK